jgi:hypothetical protein
MGGELYDHPIETTRFQSRYVWGSEGKGGVQSEETCRIFWLGILLAILVDEIFLLIT